MPGVPNEFLHGQNGRYPTAKTVGDLIRLLQLLPPQLPVSINRRRETPVRVHYGLVYLGGDSMFHSLPNEYDDDNNDEDEDDDVYSSSYYDDEDE